MYQPLQSMPPQLIQPQSIVTKPTGTITVIPTSTFDHNQHNRHG